MKTSVKKIWFLMFLSIFSVFSNCAYAHAPGDIPTTPDYSPNGGSPGSSSDRGENQSSGPGQTQDISDTIPDNVPNPGSGPATVPVTFIPAIQSLNQKIEEGTKQIKDQILVVREKQTALDAEAAKVAQGKTIQQLRAEIDAEMNLQENLEAKKQEFLKDPKTKKMAEDLVKIILNDGDEQYEESKKVVASRNEQIAKLMPFQTALDAEIQKSAKIMENLVFLKQALDLAISKEKENEKAKTLGIEPVKPLAAGPLGGALSAPVIVGPTSAGNSRPHSSSDHLDYDPE